MNSIEQLFLDSKGKWHSSDEINIALKKVGADQCDVLFVQSDISFGLPTRQLKRNAYLDVLFQSIMGIGVETVIFPTFTYSFCNGEDYDVLKSKTSMGSLNEYARKQAGVYRSLDPLLAVSVFGEKKETFISAVSDHSLGAGSIFDLLHNTDNVKFLIFGAEFSNSFTYVHYVEKMLDVPYRFDMPFEGDIIDAEGNVTHKRQYIHTACEKILPKDFCHFKDFLLENGIMKRVPLGDREICCIDEESAYYWTKEKIRERIDYFLEKPFTENDLAHIYTYDRSKGRITHC